MREFKDTYDYSVILDGDTIKLKNSFLKEDCTWSDIIDYDLQLKENKKKGKMKIKTKKATYTFNFLYSHNDFRYLYNIFCDNCVIQKMKVDVPEQVDINEMTTFEFASNRTTVVLDGNFIRISRIGAANAYWRGISGERSIKISDIKAVQIKEPGLLRGIYSIYYDRKYQRR